MTMGFPNLNSHIRKEFLYFQINQLVILFSKNEKENDNLNYGICKCLILLHAHKLDNYKENMINFIGKQILFHERIRFVLKFIFWIL